MGHFSCICYANSPACIYAVDGVLGTAMKGSWDPHIKNMRIEPVEN